MFRAVVIFLFLTSTGPVNVMQINYCTACGFSNICIRREQTLKLPACSLLKLFRVRT